MHVGCAAGAAHGCSPSCQTVRQSVPNRRAVRAAVAAATDTHTLPPPARRYLTPCEPRTKGESISIWHDPGQRGSHLRAVSSGTGHRRRDGLTHRLALSPPPRLSPPPPCCARTAAVSGRSARPQASAAKNGCAYVRQMAARSWCSHARGRRCSAAHQRQSLLARRTASRVAWMCGGRRPCVGMSPPPCVCQTRERDESSWTPAGRKPKMSNPYLSCYP